MKENYKKYFYIKRGKFKKKMRRLTSSKRT